MRRLDDYWITLLLQYPFALRYKLCDIRDSANDARPIAMGTPLLCIAGRLTERAAINAVLIQKKLVPKNKFIRFSRFFGNVTGR